MFRKKNTTPQEIKQEESPKYRAWIILPHRIIETLIAEPLGPAYTYEGKRVYLAQYKEGSTTELERYIPPGPPDDLPSALCSPEGLYNALDWRQVRQVYHIEDLLMDKLHTGLMIGILVSLLFFLFLIITNV